MRGNYYQNTAEHFDWLFGVLRNGYAGVENLKDYLISAAKSKNKNIETNVPRAGGFFYGKSTDLKKPIGHCGVVIKVDEVNRKYWTIEGNRERHDGKDGVAA